MQQRFAIIYSIKTKTKIVSFSLDIDTVCLYVFMTDYRYTNYIERYDIVTILWNEKNYKYQVQVVILLGMGMTTCFSLPIFSSWSITFHGKNLEPSNLDSNIRFSIVLESLFSPPTMMIPMPSGDVTMAWLISSSL